MHSRCWLSPIRTQSDIELDDIFEEDVTFQHGTQQDEGPSWLRMFMILVMWLACAKGLPRSCVDILLKFVADVVDGRADSVQPRVAATVKRRLGYDPKFTKFVICPDDGCQAVVHAGLAPPVCEHCSTPLFEGDGMTTPIRYFNFSSIINFLRDAFQHPTFEQRINLWRTRRSTGKIEDVTDGLAWREGGFTDNRLNLYLTLGLDWFVVFSSPNTAS
ncbi:hypothetical protein OC844_004277 [Tilletia horrida]|nr:hypothetical protein OC844_004277 [Tilletia horrida]